MSNNICSNEIHVFFVRSDFQYVVCKGIIEKYCIKSEKCVFVTDRNTKIEDAYKQSPIYGVDRYLNFLERCKFYLNNMKDVKSFFYDTSVTIYLPFQYRYPNHKYVNILFYEEGLSAYRTKRFEGLEDEHSFLVKIIVNMLSPLNDQIKGYLMGFMCCGKRPRRGTTLFSLSDACYQTIDDSFVNKQVIPLPHNPIEYYDIPENSIILVLDRLSEHGRPFELENYMLCINNQLMRLSNEGIKHIYLKYHPADYNNRESKQRIEKILCSFKMNTTIFIGRLEFLALQNKGIMFLGTNSTILFYASTLGQTNRAVSFYKQLVSIDEKYKAFIQDWGDFEKFFSKKVECIG